MNSKNILLCTLNSTYQHCSFGLRYIYAQMADLTDQTQIIEWTIKENPRLIVEKILVHNPLIVGFGVYIWNTDETLKVALILKKVAPHIKLVLGGPEISFETETQKLYSIADYVIKGEADFLFYQLCQKILTEPHRPVTDPKIFSGELPNIQNLHLPYDLYSDEDIKNRVIYVEASRGCPYKCEYCLSSLDKSVRSFDLDLFLNEMQKLINRGARQFKFVDRTFNLSLQFSTRILEFFLKQSHLSFFLHFEMVPDRLPEEIRKLIKQFPQGSLQFEIGIQTLNPEVAKNISRRNDLTKVAENFKFINTETHVYTHADLIVGLPGETLESFGQGFDQLSLWGPHEIQVGILKRLKGTPIARHEKTFQMIYQDFAPFQILSTSTMNYQTLQRMNRFAKFWDLYSNSSDFKNFMSFMKKQEGSFFWNFMKFVDYLSSHFSETHSIALLSLAEQAWLYMIQFHTHSGLSLAEAEALSSSVIVADYCQGLKKRDIPVFIKQKVNANTILNVELKTQELIAPKKVKSGLTNKRQQQFFADKNNH